MSLESDIKSMVESIGMKLYDTAIVTEHEETIYRISVTAEGGVSMDKCVEATHLISPLLDVTPPVSGEYRLEVSSPGIERKLKTLQNFKNSVGEKVAVATVEKVKLRGELLRVEGENIIINDSEAGESTVAYKDINKARTYFEW
ncbi:MAG: ribosome maturation factor RimP [Campylobacterota bacterium]|nr:ribosome maturation factor RimP [Campylobacterota bacterium]